jgi:hypothetical protein
MWAQLRAKYTREPNLNLSFLLWRLVDQTLVDVWDHLHGTSKVCTQLILAAVRHMYKTASHFHGMLCLCRQGAKHVL